MWLLPDAYGDRLGTTLATAYWLNGNGREANILYEQRPQMATATNLGELAHNGLTRGANPWRFREIVMSKSQEITQKLEQSDLLWSERPGWSQSYETNTPATVLDVNRYVQPTFSGPGIGL